ncbi:MAG: class II aldolase/adducin family protein, partial [Vallitaleaceae bacterium]|nr:class II aldolase/adducin family protein [Vallitaleaceae bacterium]
HGGMTTTSGGNLSIKDQNGDIWISPAGVDKGSLSFKDIVCVKADGSIEGIHKPSSEFPFHKRIYEMRPDLKAIVHAHPPALVAFSIVRKKPNTHLIPNMHLVCGGVGLAEYGLPGSFDLGDKIAKEFAKGKNAVILENHGIVVGSTSLYEAFMSFETLEYCARLEINANKIGKPSGLSEEDIILSKNKNHADMEEFIATEMTTEERGARREMCHLIHRAYQQKLFTSTQGTFSQKLSDGSFIITPYHVDRNFLECGDLIRIEGGKKEAGKTPSRSVTLHEAIYKNQPHVNAVIVAHPPNIMAFAVTQQDFDSRTIPESYILLREIPKLPFGITFMDPEKAAGYFDPATPIALIENDGAIVTGSSLLNAF